METAIRSFTVDQLPVEIYASKTALGQAAAWRAGQLLRAAIAARGQANLVLATGNSQLTFLGALRQQVGLDWSRVRVFHMDEYAGMGPGHPASFRRFLREKIIDAVQPAAFYGIQGEAPDLQAECARYAALLAEFPTDLCCLGIGENGHLAFNDPPYADFDDPLAVKLVGLAEKSRRQQVGEGHFASLAEVPTGALTMTIPALLAARAMLCIVPEARKAEAVRAALSGPVGTDCPASRLRAAGHCRLYLDTDSAGLVMDLRP
jgi:glucosamine-6-phosphate deaminase